MICLVASWGFLALLTGRRLWPPLAAGALGLGAVVACWTTALPGVLAVVATAVCLAGIGMWYTRDAAGAIRTMGA